MTSLVDMVQGKLAGTDASLAERVYLNRVRLFFGHAVGNMAMALIGAAVLAIVLYSADVPLARLAYWYAAVVLASLLVAVVEHKFRRVELTLTTAPAWVARRILSGSLVGLAYGVTPFLMVGNDTVLTEMFLFIALSTMVAVAVTGYSVMPQYYFLLNAVILVPLTIFFFAKGDQFHLILGISLVIWQYAILKKGWIVSKSSIKAIELNEQLRQESDDHRRTKEQMEFLAYHDPLTGLANRRFFHEWVRKSLSRATRAKTGVAFLFVDLNDFKGINDSFGHDIGDAVLEYVANQIESHVRDGDFVCRMGGDEFCVAAENIGDRESLDALSEKLMTGICGPVVLQGQNLTLSASIGVSLFPDDGQNIDAVIRVADEAMYQDKKERKKRLA